MKNKLAVLFLVFCLFFSMTSFSFALTEPEQPIINEADPVASNELIEEYNQQVDEYNVEVDAHNQQVDKDYEEAQTVYEEEKAEVETNNTFVDNVEAKIEEDSSEARGFENSSANVDSQSEEVDTSDITDNQESTDSKVPTDWEDKTTEENLKTIEIEKSDNPSGEKVKVINVHVYLDEESNTAPNQFDNDIDKDTFELSDEMKKRAVLTEWETAEIDYDDTITLSSEAEDFAGNIVWIGGQRKWFGATPKPYFFRAIEGYTQGYWMSGGSMVASTATVSENGWSPGGETYTLQYAEETTTSHYLYNGQPMTEEVITRTTDKQKPKNIFALFTYLFTRLAPEPEKKELPTEPVKGKYLERLEHLDLLDISTPDSTPEPTIEPTPEPTIEEPVVEPILDPPVKPAEEPIPDPQVKPAKEQIEKPIEEPIEELIEEPIEEPIEKPIKKPIKEPIKGQTEELIEKPIEKPIENPIEKKPQTPISSSTPITSTTSLVETIVADNTPATNTPEVISTIPEVKPPKAQPEGNWALINLIATILSCVCAIILLFVRKDKEDDEPTEEEKKDIRGMVGTKLVSVLIGVISIIIFIFTEDMTLPMVYTDKWTILMILLLIVEIINIFIIRQQSKGEKEND